MAPSHSSLGTTRRWCLSLLVAIVAATAFTTGAGAEIISAQDTQGRPIAFDVLAPGVDVEWYAGLLRSAAHGNEISTVTIRIVPESRVGGVLRRGRRSLLLAGTRGGVMVVPAGKDLRVASTFLHEYGHHLDRAWTVAGVRELNGTPVWWQQRGMAQLLGQGQVAFDYSRGWNRAIGEIFAEDYAFVHTGFQFSIRGSLRRTTRFATRSWPSSAGRWHRCPRRPPQARS